MRRIQTLGKNKKQGGEEGSDSVVPHSQAASVVLYAICPGRDVVFSGAVSGSLVFFCDCLPVCHLPLCHFGISELLLPLWQRHSS